MTGDTSYNNKKTNARFVNAWFCFQFPIHIKVRKPGKNLEEYQRKLKPKTTERIQMEIQRYHDIPSREPQGL